MPLKTAIINGDLETIKMAVAQNKALLFENIGDGTLLSHAAWHGQMDIVVYLVNAGADINDQKNSNLQTPLMRAASYGYVDVIKYLLTVPGINLNLESKSGKTALKYAINEH
jgi:ankyrin repeat protein